MQLLLAVFARWQVGASAVHGRHKKRNGIDYSQLEEM